MQSTICNYVSNHHGVTNDENRNNFKTGHSVTSKKKIKGFKIQNSETRGGDQILRSHFKKKVQEKKDQRKLRSPIRVYKNFWNYCEKVLEPKEERFKPLFTENDCEHYFKNIQPEKIVRNASHLHCG